MCSMLMVQHHFKGMVQALFEGAVYTFVFLWTPSIDAAEQRTHELVKMHTGPPASTCSKTVMCV